MIYKTQTEYDQDIIDAGILNFNQNKTSSPQKRKILTSCKTIIQYQLKQLKKIIKAL